MKLFFRSKHIAVFLFVFLLGLQPLGLFAQLKSFTLSTPDLALLTDPAEIKFDNNILLLFSSLLEKKELNCLSKALNITATNCDHNNAPMCTEVMGKVMIAMPLYSELDVEKITFKNKLDFLNLIASAFGFQFILINKTLLN